MNNSDLFQKVKELKLPIGEYALFGSAPLGVRGLRECRDIDLIMTAGLWEECKNKDWLMGTTLAGHPYLRQGDMEAWLSWQPGAWNIKKLINEAEIIDGLPFVRLAEVLTWKKLSGREKDLQDIKIIEDFLYSAGIKE